MNANKNLNFSLLKMKKTGDTIVWLSTIESTPGTSGYIDWVLPNSCETITCVVHDHYKNATINHQ